MIRANLLPPTRETATLLGLRIDVEYARRAASGAFLVALVAAVGCGIERGRTDSARAGLEREREALALNEPERAVAKRVALDVARYEEFARDAALYRRSGADAAFAVARIGNAIPQTVWLDALERDRAGYAVSGRSATVAAVGGAIDRLASATPGGAELVSLDAGSPDRRGVRFDAQLRDDSVARP